MLSYTHHVVRRGVEVAHNVMLKTADGEQEIVIPKSAAVVMGLSILVSFIMIFAISYTYGSLVPTLCMVEEPESHQYVAVSHLTDAESGSDSSAPPAYTATPLGSKNPTGADVDVDTEVFAVHNKPITSSLRRTVLHLRARAGYWSRFRGLSVIICYLIARSLIAGALASIPGLRSRGGLAITTVVATVALARWQMAWVHIVVSEPSSKKWYQRLGPLKNWTRMAPAVALQAVTEQIVQGFPMLVCGSFGPMKHVGNPDFKPGRKDLYGGFGQSLMLMLLVLALYGLLAIPATVTLVRVAASMLPEEDETIVPFDRTFGGKVTPAIIGGSGRIGLLEAWRSFGWPSRKRLLRMIVKVVLLIMAVYVFCAVILVAEADVLFGRQLKEFFQAIHRARGQN